MKKSLLFIFVFWAVFTTCTTDFDLTSDYKEIIVVYGLLNPKEESHLLRIQRSYLDDETSALVIAENPDSIYYADGVLDVSIEEIATGKHWQLERVLGDTLTPPIVKSAGTFAASSNVLYRFKGKLNENSDYQLRIENTQTGKVVTSRTPIVNDFNIVRPFEGIAVSWVNKTSPYRVRWELAENSRIYDLKIRMHYTIADISDPVNKIDTSFLDWQVFKNRNYMEENPQFEILGNTFYQEVQRQLEPNPGVVRHFESLEFFFYAGTPFLSDYINFSEAQTGLTQNQITVDFTNIEGDGLGIFSSKNWSIMPDIGMSQQSVDSLACGSITGDLGFAPVNNPNINPNYPFCD